MVFQEGFNLGYAYGVERRGGGVGSTSAWHAAGRGSIPVSDQACYITCKNLDAVS